MISKSAFVCFLFLIAGLARAQEDFDTVDPLDGDFTTGIAVGEKIPPFRAVDMNGKTWDFQSIRGPKGAVLHFYRSADW